MHVTFAKEQLGWLMTHCSVLCKQTVGNVFFITPNPKPQAGIKHTNTMMEEKIFTLNKKPALMQVRSKTWFWEMPSAPAPLLFFLFSLRWWRIQNVCVEHLDQLTAAGPHIWTRPDQRKRPIPVIYLSSLIFSSNHAFSSCYALLATSDVALVTMMNNNTRMQEHFSWH